MGRHPKYRTHKLRRQCLNCSREFKTCTRFYRLCDTCRAQATRTTLHDNGLQGKVGTMSLSRLSTW